MLITEGSVHCTEDGNLCDSISSRKGTQSLGFTSPGSLLMKSWLLYLLTVASDTSLEPHIKINFNNKMMENKMKLPHL